jgi:hypothetical protein
LEDRPGARRSRRFNSIPGLKALVFMGYATTISRKNAQKAQKQNISFLSILCLFAAKNLEDSVFILSWCHYLDALAGRA